MIKKLLYCTLFIASVNGAFSQKHLAKIEMVQADPKILMHSTNTPMNVASKTASIAVNDTLWYFYNKQRFINTTANQLFYTVQGSVASGTAVNLPEFGSSFLNTGGNSPVTISGAYVLVSKQSNASSSVPVRVYLYNANSTGFPTSKVDSANISVTTNGGSFYLANFTTPRTVAGSFFISYRIMSTVLTDTIRAWMTSANTPTSTGAASTKFGEGLSYSRAVILGANPLNSFFVNTDFYGATDGLDLEAVVAPIVSFSINSNYNVAAPNSTATPGSYCTGQTITFTNTTNPAAVVYNRQFNFNRFATVWGSIASFSVPIPTADAIDNWTFNNGNLTTTTNASTVLANPGSLNTKLTIKYRHSPFLPGDPIFNETDTKTTNSSVVACTSTLTTGINNVSGFESLSIYPNPTNSGKTTISGLDFGSSVKVYDMLGQLVLAYTADKDVVSLDLSNKANGNYIVKIMNASGNVRVLKIVNQN
jgi:hypothetical protein